MIDIKALLRNEREACKIVTVLGFPYRFSRHVTPEPNTGCWLWTGADNTIGYGKMRHPETGKCDYVHRYAYEVIVGVIPEDLEIDHICNIRSCVNPDHMELVTRQENVRRRRDRLRQRPYCHNGHEMTSENTYFDKNGWRTCRTCRNNNARRFRERKMNARHECA